MPIDSIATGAVVRNVGGSSSSSGQAVAYIAKSVSPDGSILYSISANNRMNVTHLGSLVVERWYQAKGSTPAAAFNSMSASIPFPDESELNVAAKSILDSAASFIGLADFDLFGDQLSAGLTKLLKSTTVAVDARSITVNVDNDFSSTLIVDSSLDENSSVVFSGSAITTSSRQDAPITAPLMATVSSIRTLQTNERWMSDIWGFIKGRKLSDIVIPGTHDSGTYQLGTFTGVNTAKTQTIHIGDQLKDGIRYFDMRVREAAHRGCADPSVWWLYHTWDSYKLQDALNQIEAFASKPENAKEVIILDFQDVTTNYSDDRAVDVLLASIQAKLGTYMVKIDQATSWNNSTLEQFIAQKKQIIVLMPNSISQRVNVAGYTPGCSAKFDGKYFASRSTNLRSQYEELQTSLEIQSRIIAPQLQRSVNNASFDAYRNHQSAGLLNIIQIVTRPSDSWYAAAALTLNGYPNDLLTYAALKINAPLNYEIDQNAMWSSILFGIFPPSVPLAPYLSCESGWFGKRLMMGLQGSTTDWNVPNIIILDNYNAKLTGTKFDWVLPKYANGIWSKDWKGGYVDMIVRLNQLPRNGSLAGASTTFNDGQCFP